MRPYLDETRVTDLPTLWIGGGTALHPRLAEAAAGLGMILAPRDRAAILILGAPHPVDACAEPARYDLVAQLSELGLTDLGAVRQVVWVVDRAASVTAAERSVLLQSLRLTLGQAALLYAPRVRVNAICGAGLSADTLSRPLSWLLCADAVTGQLLDLQGRG